MSKDGCIYDAEKEAENMLRYLLQLDLPDDSQMAIGSETTFIQAIDIALDRADEALGKIGKDGFFFFGSQKIGEKNNLSEMCSLHHSCNSGNTENKLSAWGKILRNEAIVSLYAWLRSMLDSSMTPYNFLLMMDYKGKEKAVGLDFLLNDSGLFKIAENSQKAFIIEEDDAKNRSDDLRRTSTTYSPETEYTQDYLASANGQLKKTIKRYDEKLTLFFPKRHIGFVREEVKYLAPQDLISKRLRIVKKRERLCIVKKRKHLCIVKRRKRRCLASQDLEIIALLKKNWGPDYGTSDDKIKSETRPTIRAMNAIEKMYLDSNASDKKYEAYSKAVLYMQKKISAADCFTQADRIYTRYRLERIFNFELIDCLWQNLSRTSERTGINLFIRGNGDTFAGCLKLPNVFTRRYIVQFAFDSLLDKSLATQTDFWQDLFESASVVTMMKREGSPEVELSLWNQRFTRMIDFLSQFLFPVYRTCFFLFLCKALRKREKKIKRKNEAIISNPLSVDLFDALSDYMNQEGYEDKLDKVFHSEDEERYTIISEDLERAQRQINPTTYKNCIELARETSFSDYSGPISYADLRKIDRRGDWNPFLNYYMLSASGYEPTKII